MKRNKNRNKNKNKKPELKVKKTSELDKNDFLKVHTSINHQTSTEVFVFSDDNDYESDAFEDSREVQSDDDESMDNFLTPINFKSVFGLRMSASTPDLTLKSKRPAESPIEKLERKKSKSTAGQKSQ